MREQLIKSVTEQLSSNEDVKLKCEYAVSLMYRQRIPLHCADNDLYMLISDKIDEYLNENEISIEYDQDFDKEIEEILFKICD